MVETLDQIMNLAEADGDVALGALQEALILLSEADRKKVLEYIKSEEE